MRPEICERVEGSIPEYIISRREENIWVPFVTGIVNLDYATQDIEYRPVVVTDSYEFSCSCPKGRDQRIRNEGWTFKNYDKTKHCPHLFTVLTIYEHHRIEAQRSWIMNMIQAPRDNINIKAYDIACKVISYKKLNNEFNKGGNKYCQTIKMTDKFEMQNYTVNKIAKSWLCSCKGFHYHGWCKHINKIKNREAHKQDMRELGISLAIKYFSQK